MYCNDQVHAGKSANKKEKVFISLVLRMLFILPIYPGRYEEEDFIIKNLKIPK